MRSRQGIVEIFSTFLRFESDRAVGWTISYPLRRSMTTCLEQAASHSHPLEAFWALYWHRRWQQQPDALAAAHITAYLQESCYWVAHKIALNFADRTLIADFFQIAIARVPHLLKHFNPQYSDNLKGYAELMFKNSLKNWLQTQEKVAVCSDWALLHRVSYKRLVQVLQNKGPQSF